MTHAHVITVSDRCSTGERQDRSGPLAAGLLGGWGLEVSGPEIVPDGTSSVREAVARACADGADLIFTTGGTGIGPRDETPEAVLPLIVKRLEGVEADIRDRGKDAPAASLSRAVVGVIEAENHRALVVTAPGSTGGVKDAVAAIGPIIAHAADQLAGGDHPHIEPAGHHHGHGHGHDHAHGRDAHAAATYATQHAAQREFGNAQVVKAGVKDSPIDMSELIAACQSDKAGAVATFIGQVRNHDAGRDVTSIDYEAHPDASQVISRVAHEIAEGSGALKIAVEHRSGHLEVGDIALGAVVSAAHRVEAFAALEALVEEVKLRLPVWKKQEFPGGGYEWSGSA
ncbi:MAG: molybdenum cofactor biosynthesis protein MoaE [Flaviflexus sp.]|nr:molybdenum cofactor biosynthesis protein MoaE [Flaviflexus sp.]